MIDWLIYFLAFAASLLTFFSGFGLGTILTPVFLIVFPVEIALTTTALVHFSNNVFKIGLLHRHIHWPTIKAFGLPAIFGAFLGVWTLKQLSGQAILNIADWWQVPPLEFAVGLIMVIFALFELHPKLSSYRIPNRLFTLGGFLSGFFGGLSGHQGALRSMFLVKTNLEKSAFVATGTGISLFIDLTRIPLYFVLLQNSHSQINWVMVAGAALSAMSGALLGNKLLHKMSLKSLHYSVGLFILLMGLWLISGKL